MQFRRETLVFLDMHKNSEIDILATYIVAMAGIGVVYFLSVSLKKAKPFRIVLSYIGRHSLVIYPLITYLPARMEFIIGSENSMIKILTKIAAIGVSVLLIEARKQLKKISN